MSASVLAGRPSIQVTVWMLRFVSLLMDLSSEVIQSLLPLYLAGGLGAPALVIGFIEELSVAIATATKFFSGVLADWSRRSKPLAVLGYGLGALARLVFPLAATVDQIIFPCSRERSAQRRRMCDFNEGQEFSLPSHCVAAKSAVNSQRFVRRLCGSPARALHKRLLDDLDEPGLRRS